MKRLLISIIFLFINIAQTYADDFYVGFRAGSGIGEVRLDKNTISTTTKKTLRPLATDLAFGTYLTPNIRSDLAFVYYTAKQNISTDFKFEASNIALMLSGYYDFHYSESLLPYVTVGVGFGRSKLSLKGNSTAVLSTTSKNKSTFVWNPGIGLNMKMNDNWVWDLGYRLRDFGSTKGSFDYKAGGEALTVDNDAAHLLFLGARYEF